MKPTPMKFKLGLIQMSCGVGVEENLQKALSRIGQAAQRGAQIICLQELFRSQYFCQKQDATIFDLAEPIPGPSTEALAAAARQHEVVIVGSLFERRDAGVYHNTAIVLDADGSLLGTYRKMHIPDDPLYYEKYYFTPGDQGYRCFDTRYGRIGVLVCWDQWYPEGARLTALQGAKVLFYPTAIGWHPAEKAQYGSRATRCLANDATCPCHCQWGLCGRSESRGSRRPLRRWTGVLGQIFRKRPIRRRAQ